MTKKQEIITQGQSLVQLINSKDFLTDFQKKNYNILVKNYQVSAENFANDYDVWSEKYNKLADNSPNKLAYKAKMDQAEKDLQPKKEALDQIEIEINNMEKLLSLLNTINQDNQEIKNKLDKLQSTTGGNTSIDLAKLATKEDLNEVKNSIGNIKLPNLDLAATNTEIQGLGNKIDNVKTVVDGLKGKPDVDLSPLTSKLDTLQNSVNSIPTTQVPGTDLEPTNTKLEEVKTLISGIKTVSPEDLTSLLNKIGDVQTSVNNIKPTPATDLSPVNTKLDSLSESLGTLTKGQEVARNKKVAELFIKNSQVIKDLLSAKGVSNPPITTDLNTFLKGIKEEQNKAIHLWLRQDPKTNLWGILIVGSWENAALWYNSPNINYYEQERNDLEPLIKTWGINRTYNKNDSDGKHDYNKNNDPKTSLIWCMALMEYAAKNQTENKGPNWIGIDNESNWVRTRDQYEALYKQYEADSPITLNCPCDITGISGKIDQVNKYLLNLPEIKAIKQRVTADAFIKGSQALKDYESKSPNALTTDPNLFIKYVKEDTNNDNFRTHSLLRQDPTTKLWGLLLNWRGGNIFEWVSPNMDFDREKKVIGEWLKTNGINKDIITEGGQDAKMNKNSDITYSYLWSLALTKITSNEWGNKRPVNWNTVMRDESTWKPQIEAELNKYDESQWKAQIEIKQ